MYMYNTIICMHNYVQLVASIIAWFNSTCMYMYLVNAQEFNLQFAQICTTLMFTFSTDIVRWRRVLGTAGPGTPSVW